MAALSASSSAAAVTGAPAAPRCFTTTPPTTRLFFCPAKERISINLSARNTGFGSLKMTTAKAAIKEVDVSKVVPQADRVLVRLEELPEKSVGGVLLPKSAVKFEHYLCGEILSAGKDAGAVSVGQKVLFSDLNAYEVNLGTTERLCFVKSGDLLAFVE